MLKKDGIYRGASTRFLSVRRVSKERQKEDFSFRKKGLPFARDLNS